MVEVVVMLVDAGIGLGGVHVALGVALRVVRQECEGMASKGRDGV